MPKSGEKIPEGLPMEGARPEEVKTADPRTHYVELDSLRGLAILLGAFAVHAFLVWNRYVKTPLTVPLLGVNVVDLIILGYFWLSLFFVLSGYLLSWTEEKRARRGAYSVRSFAVRRVLRLAPAYYFAILVVLVVWPFLSPEGLDLPGVNISVTNVLLHLLFLHALNPDVARSMDPVWWSLTAEVLFYCLLPFIVLRLTRLSQRLALFGIFFLISAATRLYIVDSIADGEPSAVWTLNLPTTWTWLCLAGVLLRMLVEYLDRRPASRLRVRLASALFLTSIGAMAALSYLVALDPIRASVQGIISLPILWMLPEMLALVSFASVMLGSPLLRAVLRWRFLAFVGMISYSLFLLHATVLLIASTFFLPKVGDWMVGQSLSTVWAAFLGYTVVVLVVAGAIAYLSYRYIESPFLSRKPTK